ncbi:hypothetical protein J4216_00315 [Candidatus Woesearchaeota archaeon]|nr:hypothetical protein [Candidatus Woesearchaeota archaeon]
MSHINAGTTKINIPNELNLTADSKLLSRLRGKDVTSPEDVGKIKSKNSGLEARMDGRGKSDGIGDNVKRFYHFRATNIVTKGVKFSGDKAAFVFDVEGDPHFQLNSGETYVYESDSLGRVYTVVERDGVSLKDGVLKDLKLKRHWKPVFVKDDKGKKKNVAIVDHDLLLDYVKADRTSYQEDKHGKSLVTSVELRRIKRGFLESVVSLFSDSYVGTRNVVGIVYWNDKSGRSNRTDFEADVSYGDLYLDLDFAKDSGLNIPHVKGEKNKPAKSTVASTTPVVKPSLGAKLKGIVPKFSFKGTSSSLKKRVALISAGGIAVIGGALVYDQLSEPQGAAELSHFIEAKERFEKGDYPGAIEYASKAKGEMNLVKKVVDIFTTNDYDRLIAASEVEIEKIPKPPIATAKDGCEFEHVKDDDGSLRYNPRGYAILKYKIQIADDVASVLGCYEKWNDQNSRYGKALENVFDVTGKSLDTLEGVGEFVYVFAEDSTKPKVGASEVPSTQPKKKVVRITPRHETKGKIPTTVTPLPARSGNPLGEQYQPQLQTLYESHVRTVGRELSGHCDFIYTVRDGTIRDLDIMSSTGTMGDFCRQVKRGFEGKTLRADSGNYRWRLKVNG